jgi:diguanylate cyclase (GGDEF)-like protein
MTTAVAIAVFSTAVGVLTLVWLAITATTCRRRAAREHTIRAASRALVLATTSDEVEAGLSVALASMLPAGVPSAAHLVDQGRRGSRVIPETGPETGPEHGRDSATVSATELGPGSPHSTIVDGRPGGLRVAVDPDPGADSGGYRVIEYVAPTAHLVELTQVLQALADQAGSALARIDLVARLRADERERYFGTLVRTSTDVILISRHGRIDYAPPSADAMFGRDVRGQVLDDVVERRTDEDTEGCVRRNDGSTRTVLVHRRDLTADPTVNGVVTTLRDVTAERDLQRSLAYRASHDSLTGLANAELLRDELRSDRACATGTGLSVVLFIDLDDFKMVNDSFGHAVGDGLLVTVARRIQSCLRSDDLAARLGGDEFAVLLRDVPGSAAARAAAQRIADALARPANVAGIGVDCQASIGLAVASTPAEFDSLMRRADTALYTAKAAGKGRWRQYQDDMISPVRRRADLRDELETAIRDDRLTLHYQPIVELSTGRVEGFEALIRCHGESAPAMRPEQLVSIAEDNALIVFLGDWVLRHALADAARFNPPDGRPPRYVSVNVSARQLRQPGFAETVRAYLAAAGVAGSLLVLEITESLLLAEDERAWNRLAELRRYGVRVAIDDYGTGYASLSYLRQPVIDIVKIDRGFLQDLTSPRARALLDAVIRLTARLGLDQIAEGVEDPHAVDVLRSLGCRHGQGFLYAPAMPAAQADQWVPVPTGYGTHCD